MTESKCRISMLSVLWLYCSRWELVANPCVVCQFNSFCLSTESQRKTYHCWWPPSTWTDRTFPDGKRSRPRCDCNEKKFCISQSAELRYPVRNFSICSHESVLFHYLFYKHFTKLPFISLTQRDAFRVNAMERFSFVMGVTGFQTSPIWKDWWEKKYTQLDPSGTIRMTAGWSRSWWRTTDHTNVNLSFISISFGHLLFTEIGFYFHIVVSLESIMIQTTA